MAVLGDIVVALSGVIAGLLAIGVAISLLATAVLIAMGASLHDLVSFWQGVAVSVHQGVADDLVAAKKRVLRRK